MNNRTAGVNHRSAARRRQYHAAGSMHYCRLYCIWIRMRQKVQKLIARLVTVYSHIESLELAMALHAAGWFWWLLLIRHDGANLPTFRAMERLWGIPVWTALALIVAVGQLIGLRTLYSRVRYYSAILAIFFWSSAVTAYIWERILPFSLIMSIVNATANLWILAVPPPAINKDGDRGE